MNGRPRQVYMNKEIEEKALEVCKRHAISMSKLIKLALEKYITEVDVAKVKEEQ